MKRKHVSQDVRFVSRRIRNVDPEDDGRSGVEPLRLDLRRRARHPVAEGVDSDHGRSRFRVLASQFVFTFGSRFEVHGSRFTVPYACAMSQASETPALELPTETVEPNLNTN